MMCERYLPKATFWKFRRSLRRRFECVGNINFFRLDSHSSEHVADYMNQMQFQQQPMQVIQPPQQEELQTVTHKKVVVRTIQTRDGQVSKVISSPIGYIFV